MGKKNYRYVARAVNGRWQIFNRKMQRNWGLPFKEYPQKVLDQLNDPNHKGQIKL